MPIVSSLLKETGDREIASTTLVIDGIKGKKPPRTPVVRAICCQVERKDGETDSQALARSQRLAIELAN